MRCWQEQLKKGFLPQREAGWVACGGQDSVRGAYGGGREPLSEWYVICLEPLHVVAVPGRCCPHTGAPGKDFLRSDETQSLPRPHVSGRPLQSPAFQAQV